MFHFNLFRILQSITHPVCGRHRRTHETQAAGHHASTLSDEEHEHEENEFGSVENDSPPSDAAFLSANVVNMANVTSMPSSMAAQPNLPTMVAPQMISLQHI
jgi:hypothetical protein